MKNGTTAVTPLTCTAKKPRGANTPEPAAVIVRPDAVNDAKTFIVPAVPEIPPDVGCWPATLMLVVRFGIVTVLGSETPAPDTGSNG